MVGPLIFSRVRERQDNREKRSLFLLLSSFALPRTNGRYIHGGRATEHSTKRRRGGEERIGLPGRVPFGGKEEGGLLPDVTRDEDRGGRERRRREESFFQFLAPIEGRGRELPVLERKQCLCFCLKSGLKGL